MAAPHDPREDWRAGEGTFADTSSAVGDIHLRQDGYVFMDEMFPFLNANLGVLPASYAVATSVFNRNDWQMAQPVYLFKVTRVSKDEKSVFDAYPTWFKYNLIPNYVWLADWYSVKYKFQDDMIGWVKQHNKDSNDLVVAVPSYVQMHIHRGIGNFIHQNQHQAEFAKYTRS